MAVANTKATATVSSLQTLNITRALFTNGANIGLLKADVAVAAADDDGSVYRLWQGLDPRLRPLIIMIGTTAITGGTSYGLGLYDTSDGAVINSTVFMSAQTMASAVALSHLAGINGLSNLANTAIGKMLYEHAGHSGDSIRTAYDICLTAATVGSAAGTISAAMLYALPSQ